MLVAVRNRLSRAGRAVAPRIRTHVECLEQGLKHLDRGLRDMLRQSPAWLERDGLCAPFPEWGRNSLWYCWPKGARWAAGR